MSYIIKEYKMIENNTYGDEEETQIKIERPDGMIFIVNIPEFCWQKNDGENTPCGLNLVSSGDAGDHYL